ncbi:MAG: hypothetical protein IPI67_15010 [Myxococcales bacterium]|nr:hypothetical protein [Myxococcales bacterium]
MPLRVRHPAPLLRPELWLLVAFACLPSCSRGPEPCASAGTCPEGQECLANRCVVAGGAPVSEDSQRLVLEPDALAVVGAGEPQAAPVAVTFGGGASGKVTLYLKFPRAWREAKRIEAAFLLLEPMPASFGSTEDVTVEVWRVREPWSADTLAPAHLPELAPPSSQGIARSSPPSPLRVDVTALVTYLAKHPHSDFGFALRASPGAGAGASYATGSSGGRSPRLELYVR